MILRGPILAEESRVLRMPAGTRSVAPPAAVMSAGDEGAQGAEHCAIDSPALPEREPLTLESVASWLAVQDGDTREALAALLADELESVYEKARVQGFAQGGEAARIEAERSLASSSRLLEAVATAAEAKFDAECVALAGSCADIVGEALTKIAGPVLGNAAAAVGAVEQVLRRVKDERELIIRVHAVDVETIRAAESRLVTVLAGRKLQVVADARVELGGCIVESSLGGLDGRFDVQLRELFETLRAVKGSRELP
jgi:flagellar assembly protein FliH